LARLPAARFEHYVPKVYLRPFVAEGQGRDSIYRFDKIRGTTSLKNIAGVAGARNFYESPGTQGADSIEEYLGLMESGFGPVRDKLLAAQDLGALTHEEKRAIARFAATQFVRTQEIRQSVRDLIASIKDSLKGERLSERLRGEIEEAQSKSSIQNVHLSMLGDVPWIAGSILERKWIIIVNKTAMPFWTSDHPINLRNEIEPPAFARMGIGLPEIQIYLPLSPKLSLLICDYRYYMYEPDKMVARDVNNIVFQNDWQLRQSTQFLFSNADDFSLARRIIESVPEIADPARRRVAHFRAGNQKFRAWRPPSAGSIVHGLLS
jgi:hypothetical protein